jgi:hypothetical protein
MTCKSPTFPLIYHDDTALFLEWPTYALRFPFTEAGLHKALAQIPKLPTALVKPSSRGNIADRVLPKVARSTLRKREILNFSKDQRNAASAVIRKLKVGS